jgi:hypothetical protein
MSRRFRVKGRARARSKRGSRRSRIRVRVRGRCRCRCRCRHYRKTCEKWWNPRSRNRDRGLNGSRWRVRGIG